MRESFVSSLTHPHTQLWQVLFLLRTEGYQFDRLHFANNLQIGDSGDGDSGFSVCVGGSR